MNSPLRGLFAFAAAALAAAGMAAAPGPKPVRPRMNVGTTFSGFVTATGGAMLELANGRLTIDASPARVVSADSGESISIDAVRPGDSVFGIYTGSPQLGAPLPALEISVRQLTPTEFGGVVQSVDNGIEMLGRRIPIDGRTTFGNHVAYADGTRLLQTFETFAATSGDQIYAYLGRDGRADDITRVWFQPPAPGEVIHGEIESFAADKWVIRGFFDETDHIILVNRATRVLVDPSIGRTVDAIVPRGMLSATFIGDLENAIGPVTAVGDRTLTVGGFLTFDTTDALAQDGEVAAPGDQVWVTYGSANLPRNAAIPAIFIMVRKATPFALAGHVQQKNESSVVLAGRTIAIDAATRFCDGHSFADLQTGDQVWADLRESSAGLVATDVCEGTVEVPDFTAGGDMVRGVVTRADGAAWTICNVAGAEVPLTVNAETKVSGAVGVGDTVEALVEAKGVTAAIEPAYTDPWLTVFACRGTLKDASPSFFRFGPADGTQLGADYRMAIQSGTRVIGNPKVGDVVELLYDRWVVEVRVAAPVEPEFVVRGVVKWSSCPRDQDGRRTGECGWGIKSTFGPEYLTYAAPDGIIKGDPQAGDCVTAVITPNPDGYVVRSIAKTR